MEVRFLERESERIGRRKRMNLGEIFLGTEEL